jgi:DNA-binding response OmpR family regulator
VSISVEKVNQQSGGPAVTSKTDSAKDLVGHDPSQSISDTIGPVVSVILTADGFDMLLTDSSEDAVDIVANTDYYSLFIKDQTVSSCLDKYSEAISAVSEEETPLPSASRSIQENPEFYLPLTKRLWEKSPHAKVILTAKKKIPAGLYPMSKKYLVRLCARLDLPVHDRVLINGAGEIHNLLKFRHPDHSSGGFKSIADTGAKCLPLLNKEPILVRMLRSMYCNLERKDAAKPSLELIGANILTIIDLLCDTPCFEDSLTRDKCMILRGELGKLTGKLLLKEVVEALFAVLEEELPGREKCKRSNQIVVFSDRPDRFNPLMTRLKNESFQPIITETMESFVTTCKRLRPDIIIMRHQSLPHEIVKTLKFISSKGINVSSTPTFLLVKGIFVDHMAPLLETGIEDVIDLDGSIDLLMVKVKKIRTQLEKESKKAKEAVEPQSGSRGNLSDMNLIDLLQALGPSQRTARITVKSDDISSDPLLMYLSQGQITFATLGDLLGATAIHRALGWRNGTWLAEPIAEEMLPEPNNTLPNESILLEGCRLMDESSR